MGTQIEVMSFDTLGKYFADTVKMNRYLTSVATPIIRRNRPTFEMSE